MAINRDGGWWRGTIASDIEAYLREFTAQIRPASLFIHARCTCGSPRFKVEADDGKNAARRTCMSCGGERLMLDSGRRWGQGHPQGCRCPCGGEVFEVAAGFTHRADRSVQRVTLGMRCVSCGMLGVYADWDVPPGETMSLYAGV